jgi:hypothetical protein
MSAQAAPLRPYKVTHSLADPAQLDALLADVFGDAWGDPVVVFNSGIKFSLGSCTCYYTGPLPPQQLRRRAGRRFRQRWRQGRESRTVPGSADAVKESARRPSGWRHALESVKQRRQLSRNVE